ncbi:MAG TPA: SpoIIE family protein phosphatase [Firmicutes bacterium]|nr:SpoIIE family protein phosphatase [Bacillota bacterium]
MSVFVEISHFSLPKHGEELPGDSIHVARTPGSVIAALADGLGSGVKASILSTLTTRIAVTLLKGGASLDNVVETLGSTLPTCKVRKIAYSTFTIVQVLDGGDTYIAEFDNPPTFIIRDGRIFDPGTRELEVSGKRVREARLKVVDGDFIVLVSDGVIHAGVGGVMNLGWQWSNVARYLEEVCQEGVSADTVSERLSRVTHHLYGGSPGDDATGIVLHVRRPRSITVLAGPPRDRRDDSVVTRELLSEPGKKVVCGGTTSLIVARALGTEVDVDLDTMTPDLPPSGSIKGIDLVTEGVITLSKVLDIVRSSGSVPLFRRNAAEELAGMLLDSDKIRFIVGGAINPAHQNPGLPHNLALKAQVVSELARLLEQRGKQVELEFH